MIIATTSPAFGQSAHMQAEFKQRKWCLKSLISNNLTGPELMADTLRQMDAMAGDMDCLSVGLAPVNAEFIAKATRLKAIVKFGVGVDNIDVEAATARKIPVINAPGANSNAVAELALGYMFELARGLWNMHNTVLAGGWRRHVGIELEGKVLGIVGLGSIGKILAKKAQALGMTVIATDPYMDAAFCAAQGLKSSSLNELLAEADFVSLHMAGGPTNRNIIGAAQLHRMKKGAFLMNLSRGDMVDTQALTVALQNGHLGGAALDAFVVEPPDRSELLFSLPNVFFTPHVGGHSLQAQLNVNRMNLEDLSLLVRGEKPRRIVNPIIYA